MCASNLPRSDGVTLAACTKWSSLCGGQYTALLGHGVWLKLGEGHQVGVVSFLCTYLGLLFNLCSYGVSKQQYATII